MKSHDGVASIILVIENRQPVPALALSELLAALARDYRKQNRARTLVVERVENGSIWITLLDMAQAALPYAKGAVEAAKGSKAIIDFGKSLIGLLNVKKINPDSAGQLQTKAPERSIEKLVKLAVDANCNVQVRQVEVDGSCIEVNITRSEAVAIQEGEHYWKEAKTLRHSSSAPERDLNAKHAAKIADEFERLQISEESTVNDALQIILGVIKQSGDAELLRSLAVELERRGYNELAEKIRKN